MRGGGFHSTRTRNGGDEGRSTPNQSPTKDPVRNRTGEPSWKHTQKSNSHQNGEQSWKPLQNVSERNNNSQQNSELAGLDNWDPMKDDHKNSVSQDRTQKRGNTSNDPCVHVKGIPASLEEDGLRSIIRDKLPRCTATRVNLMPLKEGFTNKFGFIHFSTVEACQEAIAELDGYTLGTSRLGVSVSKRSQVSDNFSKRPNGGSQRSDNFSNGPNSGSQRSDNFSNGPSSGSRPSNATNWGAEQGSTRTDIITIPTSDRNGGQVTSPSKGNKAAVCNNCGAPAGMVCEPCKGTIFYCSVTCQMSDWPKHQKVCGFVSEAATAMLNNQTDTALEEVPEVPFTLLSFPKISMPDLLECLFVFGTSPLQFAVQSTENKAVIENITETMYSFYDNKSPQPRFAPKERDIVAAKFEGDWYRAEVVVSGRETLKVRYIDYGNESEVVQGDIRSLTHLETIMPQAIQCRLDDLAVPNEYSDEVINFFQNKMMDSGEHLTAKLIKEVDGVFMVEIFLKTGENLGGLLVSHGYASRISSPPISSPPTLLNSVAAPATTSPKSPYSNLASTVPLNTVISVNVSYITNFEEMYVCMIANSETLFDLTNSMTSHIANATPGGHLSSGDAVICPFEGIPCRAVVLEKLTGDQLKVKFVDFGNEEVCHLSEAFGMSEEFMQIPELAIKCKLDWSTVEFTAAAKAIEEHLRLEYPDGLAVECTFLRNDGDTFVVQLQHEGAQNELDKIIAAGLCKTVCIPMAPTTPSNASSTGNLSAYSTGPSPARATTGRSPPSLTDVSKTQNGVQNKRKVVYYKPSCVPLDTGTKYETSICNITNPTLMHANFLTPIQKSSEDFLESVRRGGECLPTFGAMGCSPEVDELVLCFSDDFQQWYRACVKSVAESSCLVYSLDYGKTENVGLDAVVAGEETHNCVPPLAFSITFQASDKILARLRDTVPKDTWEPILQELLLQENFECLIVSQDSLDVVVKPSNDFDAKLRQKVKPIAESMRQSSNSNSVASTPPLSTPLITSEPLPNGDVTIPVNEWEHMVLTMDRMKREIRELKRDNSELKRDIILVKQAMQSNGWNV